MGYAGVEPMKAQMNRTKYLPYRAEKKRYSVTVVIENITTGEQTVFCKIITAVDERTAIEYVTGKMWSTYPPERYYCIIKSIYKLKEEEDKRDKNIRV